MTYSSKLFILNIFFVDEGFVYTTAGKASIAFMYNYTKFYPLCARSVQGTCFHITVEW